jgi:hypothetical protein
MVSYCHSFSLLTITFLGRIAPLSRLERFLCALFKYIPGDSASSRRRKAQIMASEKQAGIGCTKKCALYDFSSPKPLVLSKLSPTAAAATLTSSSDAASASAPLLRASALGLCPSLCWHLSCLF